MGWKQKMVLSSMFLLTQPMLGAPTPSNDKDDMVALSNSKLWAADSGGANRYFHINHNGKLVVGAYEAGSFDYNQDGSYNDIVLHVHDTKTGETHNTGLSVLIWGIVTPQPNGPGVSFLIDEDGQDLNGDGDGDDLVTGILNTDTLEVIIPPFPGYSAVLMRKHALLSVVESLAGVDLNGDGDLEDDVLHRFNLEDHSLDNVGMAVNIRHCFPLFTNCDPRKLRTDQVVFAVSEQDQTDLNNDGDNDDHILFRYHVETNQLINLNYDVHSVGASGRAGTVVYFDEAKHGDLNADGDNNDVVASFLTPFDTTAQNLQLAVEPGFETSSSYVDSHLAALYVSEAAHKVSLNGDGDKTDQVIHVYDPISGQVTNLGRAVVHFIAPRFTKQCVLFETYEFDEGQSYNNDADNKDYVLQVWDRFNNTLFNTGLAAIYPTTYPPISQNHYVVPVSEREQGQSDLNGDGDLRDVVPHVIDLASFAITNLGVASSSDVHYEFQGVVAYRASEADQRQDLNRDGDLNDHPLMLYHLARQQAWYSSDSTTYYEPYIVNQSTVGVLFDERNNNKDYNGDGNLNGAISFGVDFSQFAK